MPRSSTVKAPSPAPLRLLTIHPSHYCEKARWALDLLDTDYVEEGFPPGRHLQPVKRAAGKEYHSTPVLVVADGATAPTILTESSDIVRWVHDRRPELGLLPAPDTDKGPNPSSPAAQTAAGLMRYFDEELGPHTRRVVYYHLLRHPKLFLSAGLSLKEVPWYVSGVGRVAVPAARVAMARGEMQITAAETAKSTERLQQLFAEVSAMLDGRQYLVGDAFSAADLTFAALAAPVLLPPQYGAVAPQLDDFPAADPFPALVKEFRATAAGQHGLRMYATHRPTTRARQPK